MWTVFGRKRLKTYRYYLGLIKFENHDTFQLVTGRDVMSLLICYYMLLS